MKRVSAVVAILLAATILAEPASALLPVPATEVAKTEDSLFRVINGIALVIGVVVEAFLVWLLVKFYRNRDIPRDDGFRGHTKAEIAWTFAPIVVLVFISYQTVVVMETTDQTVEALREQDALEVRVVGHQFLWEFIYPGEDATDPNRELHNTLEVREGTLVLLNVTSDDVGHAFSVPEFGIMIDAWPTRDNHQWFRAPAFKQFDDTTGDYITKEGPNDYFVQCREYCGAGHSAMHSKIVVFSQADPREADVGPASLGTDACAAPLDGRREVPVVLKESGGTGGRIWSVDPPSLTLPAGAQVRFVASIDGVGVHNLALGPPVNEQTPDFRPPARRCLDVTLPAAAGSTVEYFCAVPGHKDLGMTAELTLQ